MPTNNNASVPSGDLLLHLDALHEAINIACAVQNSGKAIVFIDLSGHVSKLDVSVYVPCWKANVNPSFEGEVYLDGHEDDVAELIRRLRVFAARFLNPSA